MRTEGQHVNQFYYGSPYTLDTSGVSDTLDLATSHSC